MNAITMPSSRAYNIVDHTYDVVVVGAGGSGLRATFGMGASGLKTAASGTLSASADKNRLWTSGFSSVSMVICASPNSETRSSASGQYPVTNGAATVETMQHSPRSRTMALSKVSTLERLIFLILTYSRSLHQNEKHHKLMHHNFICSHPENLTDTHHLMPNKISRI